MPVTNAALLEKIEAQTRILTKVETSVGILVDRQHATEIKCAVHDQWREQHEGMHKDIKGDDTTRRRIETVVTAAVFALASVLGVKMTGQS
jgi:hypothetical protein